MDLDRAPENKSEYDQNSLHEDMCAEDTHYCNSGQAVMRRKYAGVRFFPPCRIWGWNSRHFGPCWPRSPHTLRRTGISEFRVQLPVTIFLCENAEVEDGKTNIKRPT